jgi:hypothetical protein
MENQNNRDNQKGKPSLPPLLSGSEYKTNDRYCNRRMNLLVLAVTIVVYAKKDGISGDGKEEWFKLFENKCAKVVQQGMKVRDFNRRHPRYSGHRSSDTGSDDWYEKRVLAWLKNSLFKAPDWDDLYVLVDCHIIWLKKDPSTDWWKEVQSVCKRVETTVDTFDPITEILRITKEYHAKNETVRQNETGDNDTETDAEETEQKALTLRQKIWIWFKNHPHSYGLTVGVIFLMLFFVLGLVKAQWRNWCWGTAVLALLVLIPSLLGGKSSR